MNGEPPNCDPPETLPADGLPFADNGEVLLLPGLPGRGPDDSRYRGGVTYFVPGVAGGVSVGSRPRSDRWEGVNAMSERSSFGRNKG